MGEVGAGDLVVLRGALERGVFRVERLLELDGVKQARVLSYQSGRFSVVPLGELLPCPPGTPAQGSP